MNGHDAEVYQQLRGIYEDAANLARQPMVSSGGRGDFYFPDSQDRKTALSVGLLTALLQGHQLETVLQRTIVEVMHKRPHAWFNEFNVAAGCAGGGSANNRHAVDLGRILPVQPTPPTYDLELIELKQWVSTEDPDVAAKKLFKAFSAYWHLVQLGVEPYVNARNQVNRVRLAVMAPESYFRFYGAGPEQLRVGNQLLQPFHQALNLLKEQYPQLTRVAFHPHAVVLSDELDADDFVDLFNQECIQEHIRDGRCCDCPTNVLHLEAAACIRKWVNEALDAASLNRKE